jgi:hypothetical protein
LYVVTLLVFLSLNVANLLSQLAVPGLVPVHSADLYQVSSTLLVHTELARAGFEKTPTLLVHTEQARA